jgi:outer membrane protein TolC
MRNPTRRAACLSSLAALLTATGVLSAQEPAAQGAAPRTPAAGTSAAQRSAPAAARTPQQIAAELAPGEDSPALDRFLEHADFRNGLTADEVAARAVAQSAVVEQRQAIARGAKAQEDEAVARLVPDLTLSGRYTRINNIQMPNLTGGGFNLVGAQAPPGQLPADQTLVALPAFTFPILLNQYELKATLSIPVSDYVYRTGTAISAAEHSSASARWDEEATKLKVAADARLAYYDWVRAIGQRIVAEEALENLLTRQKDAQVLYEAGLLSRADLLGAQAQTKEAEVFTVRARHFARIAEERLRTITYEPDPNRVYKVGENLLEPVADVQAPKSPDALLEEAVRNRAELKTLAESEESIKALVSLAKSEAHPRLDLVGNYIYANPNPRIFPQQERFDSTWDVNVLLTWRPTAIFRANAVAAQQEARMSELRAQRRALVEGLRLEVTEASQGVSEADATLEAAQEALEAASESYRGRRELFRMGQGTLVDVSDAEVALTRARLALINAHIDARTSRVRLRYALGRDRVPQGQ